MSTHDPERNELVISPTEVSIDETQRMKAWMLFGAIELVLKKQKLLPKKDDIEIGEKEFSGWKNLVGDRVSIETGLRERTEGELLTRHLDGIKQYVYMETTEITSLRADINRDYKVVVGNTYTMVEGWANAENVARQTDIYYEANGISDRPSTLDETQLAMLDGINPEVTIGGLEVSGELVDCLEMFMKRLPSSDQPEFDDPF